MDDERTLRAAVQEAAADALALLYPVACVGCRAPDRDLCDRCRASLRAAHRDVRLVAGVRCDAAFEYTGIARAAVLGFKVHGRTRLARELGPPLGVLVRAALAASPSGSRIVRVPPSRIGSMRRGFDPVTLALRHGGIGRTGVLRRARGAARATGGQKSRSAVERVAATVGSLRAVRADGRTFVLVDDVVTTGTTMAEAVRAIRAAGGVVSRCVAIASVQ